MMTYLCEVEMPAMSAKTKENSEQETRKAWLRKLFLAVPLLFACFCFWQALPDSVTGSQPAQALTATAPSQPERQLVTRRIDEIEPGHRVLADNPIATETHRDASEPNSIDDRLINFRMLKTDGSFVDISLVRPIEWMEAVGVRQGGIVQLDYPEFGAVGSAEVLAILPCPEIEQGQGEVVTGTFTHSSGDILDILITGESKPIGTTGNHPWWSEDRQKFVEASELKPGETLRTAAGKLTQIVSITPRASAETVYNLEVNREHVYYVGESGLLVHNTCPNGLRNASKGLREIFSGGSVRGKNIISIRESLLQNGFTQSLAKNKKGYLFLNSAGEQVRVMRRNGAWDLRVRNGFGNYLDEFGDNAAPSFTHGISVLSQ